MSSIIQFTISKGEKQYVASGINVPIVTQGKTLDELSKNIKEAVELHFEGESFAKYDLKKKPSVLLNFELPVYA
jgi:predicted RNase H-like HicB family nuclease